MMRIIDAHSHVGDILYNNGGDIIERLGVTKKKIFDIGRIMEEDYKYVFLLNNDAMFVQRDSLQILMYMFNENTGITMQNAGCWCQDSVWPTRTGEKEPFRKDLHPYEARKLFHETYPDDKCWIEQQVGFWATMIKLDLFEKYGLFDERFKVICQDLDWEWRVGKYGYHTKVIGAHLLSHHGKTHCDIKPGLDIEPDERLIREIWPEKYQGG